MAGRYDWTNDKRTNEELVALVQAGNTGLMESLWYKNRGLIAMYARKYRDDKRADYDIEDVYRQGIWASMRPHLPIHRNGE